MKFTAKLFLVGLIVPLLSLGVLSASIKFQILSSKFWLGTFEKHNVYTLTAEALKKQAEDAIIKDGGGRNDAKVLTDLITPENLKDLAEKNITNFLTYANGGKNELTIYLPIKKVPKGLLPKNFASLPEEITLSALLAKFGISTISNTQIQQLSLLGRGLTYFLILDLTLSGVFIFLLFLLTDAGSRFIAPSVAFILTGFLVLFSFWGGVRAQTGQVTDTALKSSPAQIILMNILPPVVQEISKAWVFTGLALMLIGVVLLFFKRK